MRNDIRHDNSDPPAWRTEPAGGLVILAIASLSLLAAACGSGSASPSVASVGSTTTIAPASSLTAGNSGTSTAGAVAYAKCMRSHGLSDFPDPNTQGGFDDLPSNISFNSPHYIAANKVCQPLNGGGRHLSPADQEEIEARGLKFAQCMRSYGVLNFPDPTFNFSGSGVSEKQGDSNGAVDAASPRFQAAQKACQQARAAGAP